MIIILHWVMALAIFGLFALGLWMTTLDYYDAWYHRAPDIHKSVGMLMLFLLFFRLAWVAFSIKPEIFGAAWERLVALIVHRTHYVLMLGVMISGYLIPTAKGAGIDVFGWFTVPALVRFTERQGDVVGLIHWGFAWAVIALAGLHTAAALKHHFIDRDATLMRMLGIIRH
jgi:cytochrome b561